MAPRPRGDQGEGLIDTIPGMRSGTARSSVGRGRFMLRTIALVGCLSGSLWAPASAAVTKTIQIGNWSIAAHADDQTRHLDHCSAKLTNAGGVTLTYSMSAQLS